MERLKDIIKAGIEEYTDGCQVVSFEMCTDTTGAIAIRAVLQDPGAPSTHTLDFLIIRSDIPKCKDATSTSRVLEDVEFMNWPPRETVRKIF